MTMRLPDGYIYWISSIDFEVGKVVKVDREVMNDVVIRTYQQYLDVRNMRKRYLREKEEGF